MSDPGIPQGHTQARATRQQDREQSREIQLLMEEMARMRNTMNKMQEDSIVNRNQVATVPDAASRRIKKGDPPSFTGKDREDVEKFIFLTEEFYYEFDGIRTAATEEFARIVMTNLKGDASTWFQNYTEVARAEGTLRTWEDMKEKLRAQFGKADDKMKAIEKILRAKQRGSVQEFSNFLITNMLRSGEQWPENIKIGILRVALNTNLANEISRRSPTTLAEAIKIAKAEEARHKKPKTPPKTDAKPGEEEKPKPGSKYSCYDCGEKGHKSPDCKASEEKKNAFKQKREDARAKAKASAQNQ